MRLLIACLLAGTALAAVAQQSVPVEELGREREQAVQRGQIQAGGAYRDWQNALHDVRLTEQDVLNLEEAHRRSSAETVELKRRLDAAKKLHAAAQARAAERRQVYEQAVKAVDSARRETPAR